MADSARVVPVNIKSDCGEITLLLRRSFRPEGAAFTVCAMSKTL